MKRLKDKSPAENSPGFGAIRAASVADSKQSYILILQQKRARLIFVQKKGVFSKV